MERFDKDGNCSCSFNITNSRGGKGSTAVGGGAEKTDESAQQCVDECRQEYLKEIWPDYNNETFGYVCTALSTKDSETKLWPLYWCDSTFCGVWLDQSMGLGQDREWTRGLLPETGLTKTSSQC